jgi:hypothetical protein
VRRRVLAAVLVVVMQGCFATATPAQRVTDAARELNLATRFGQVDVAVHHVHHTLQADFLSRRSQWGNQIRILDVELVSIHIANEEHANVAVEVSWSSVTDSLLRTTKVQQDWENVRKGWKLVGERRLSGDTGLFGEALPRLEHSHPDVHRTSRTIR